MSSAVDVIGALRVKSTFALPTQIILIFDWSFRASRPYDGIICVAQYHLEYFARAKIIDVK